MARSTSFVDLVELAHARPLAAAIILGSGMGPAAARVETVAALPFTEVPELSTTTVPGHSGRLRLGDWAGQRVLLFEGRLHFYESGSWRTATAPVHTARFLGAPVLLLTNAAGGIRPDLVPGTLMALRAHLEWTRPNAWRHSAKPTAPYSPRLRALLHAAARDRGIALAEGVYAAVTGPCYETPAEIRALWACGADAVGMSTVHEARASCELGMECAAMSLITNRAAGLVSGTIDHKEVIATATGAGHRLAGLVEAFLERLGARA